MTLLTIGLPVNLTRAAVYESTEPGIPRMANQIDGT